MGIKSILARPYGSWIRHKVKRDSHHALTHQNQMLLSHLKKAENTQFGKQHHFKDIKNHRDYCEAVQIRDYEGIKSYFDRIVDGEKDILWPGKPRYLAKTSGTTSGQKFIPITSDSLPNHFGTARNAVFNYASQTGNFKFMDGKMIFLSGSPELESKNGILIGRLSGISNHLIPSWVRQSQLPSYSTNIIKEWEQKVDRIVEETVKSDLRLISGIPPWVQMYFERLLDKTGAKTVLEVFPNFSIFVYGGVNYEPYRVAIEKQIGGRIDSVETFPASEGFIAFQDQVDNEGLLLNTNSGIFFEFVPLNEIGEKNPTRLKLNEVELGKDYALIITSNAGLWAYNLGDTIRFVNLDPYRIIVSGRIQNFISAFGEHVIAKEVEDAMRRASEKLKAEVAEFTVAPQVNPPEGGPPYHEWFVEFNSPPKDIERLEATIDEEMVQQNIYYKDLIEGKILRPLRLRPLEKDAFRKFMKARGKLGGQNKVPRLNNDRKMVEELKPFLKK